MADRFRISALLARQLRGHGVSVEAVLRHARLPEAFFRQARVLATTEELFALWRQKVRAIDVKQSSAYYRFKDYLTNLRSN